MNIIMHYKQKNINAHLIFLAYIMQNNKNIVRGGEEKEKKKKNT